MDDLLASGCPPQVSNVISSPKYEFPNCVEDPICVTVNSMHTIHTIARQVLDEHLVSESHPSNEEFSSSSRLNKQKDFMSMLVSSKTAGLSTEMDKECMVDQVVAFLGAGHETIAGALSWVRTILPLLGACSNVRNLLDPLATRVASFSARHSSF